jgi:hemin uptake protein HemP
VKSTARFASKCSRASQPNSQPTHIQIFCVGVAILNSLIPNGAVAANAIKTVRAVLDSVQLFHGRQEVVIRHAGQEYRLRITSQNKLILTK